MATRFPYGEDALVTVAFDASSLGDPPVQAGDVSFWKNVEVAEFEMYSATDVTVTDLEVIGGALNSVVLANDDVDAVVFASDELTVTAHSYVNGDGPVRLTTTDTLPTGLSLLTDYWVEVVDANTIKLHSTLSSVFDQNLSAVSFTDVGVGTHTIVAQSPCKRVAWLSQGFYISGTGSVVVRPTKGRRFKVDHSTRTVLYAIQATFVGVLNVYVLPVKSA